MSYLNFSQADCKNCYKCLRECPVKAITVKNEQAKIDEDLCILCGRCSNVCRFNAKKVSDGITKVKALIASGKPTYASIAPAFVASFGTDDWNAFSSKILELGFFYAEETARGAHSVVAEYKDILDAGTHRNLIASACPSVVRLIQLYYPKALPYLAMVDSPMVAHAKLLKNQFGDINVVFIGPCISKKREAEESGFVDGVLTFEELVAMLSEQNISIQPSAATDTLTTPKSSAAKSAAEIAKFADSTSSLPLANRAKYFPINRGVIKSFESLDTGYEYVSVDGVSRIEEVLSRIDSLSGMFLEMHACEFSCINGPCSLSREKGDFIKGTEQIRNYVKKEISRTPKQREKLNFAHMYPTVKDKRKTPTDYEVKQILAEIGKTLPEHELNCGACGYNTCRDKAFAVYNGRAELTMCVPFMRERAENMSYEIIQNSPNGIIAVDSDFRIVDINAKAISLLGIDGENPKTELLERYFDPVDFYLAYFENETISNKKIHLPKTDSYVEINITVVKNQSMIFAIMKDITHDTNYKMRLDKVKQDTLATTNNVIEKQMRVVQEIASLLGETTAETKIALIKLKNTLQEEN